MGTNYYLQINVCHECGRPEKELHIGKSSAGWCFGLRVYPKDKWDEERMVISNLEDWKELWGQEGSLIKDEYNREVSPEDMLLTITQRSHPRGLRRHLIDGSHTIGHGKGTWDLHAGDFC